VFTDMNLAEAVIHEVFAVPVLHVIEALDVLNDAMTGGRTR
jgi:hypothetical protein